MQTRNLILALGLCMLASCDSADYGVNNSMSEVSESVQDTVNETTVVGELNSGRKLVRTADIACRTKDVVAATHQLERIVNGVGGIVMESKVEQHAIDEKTVAYTTDSERVVRVLTSESNLTLKVPAGMLDSVVHALPHLSSEISYSNMMQRDVTLQLYNNELLNKPSKEQHVEQAAKKRLSVEEALAVQQYEDERTKKAIARKVENLRLMDDVNYATLTVKIYSPEYVIAEIVPNKEALMKPPYWTECKTALLNGMTVVKGVVLLLLTIWPVLVFVALVILVVNIVLRKTKRVRTVS